MSYQTFLRPFLFRADPEWAHDQAIRWCERCEKIPGLIPWMTKRYRADDPRLQVKLGRSLFNNPIGLAAGYDKSGRAIRAMASLGFGHIEIGSISASPSQGNPKPRLWRLPQDQAICVNYGLPNEGAQAIASRLVGQQFQVPLGINLVNTNRGPSATASTTEQVLDDYVDSAKMLARCADYFMLNLSCPNTGEGRAFFDTSRHLVELLHRFTDLNIDVPIFLKISPDWNDAAIERFLESINEFRLVDGLMFNLSPTWRSGLTKDQQLWKDRPGAISGKPIRAWMNQNVARLHCRIDTTRYKIIAAGGVYCADDAYRLIRSGASLVQVLTAMIYQGPGVVKEINRGLIRMMDREGIPSISSIVGTDAKRNMESNRF